MKKIYVLVVAILTSCSPVMSPAFVYSNASSDGSEIRNIHVVWNQYHLLDRSGPINVCGKGGIEQNFTLQKQSDLFGPVHAEWENAKGEKISKDFIFKKEDMPTFKRSIFGKHVYHVIILFFTQSDLEYYTSDNPRFKEIEWEKSGNWINKWFEKEQTHKCVNDPKEVKRVKENAKRLQKK